MKGNFLANGLICKSYKKSKGEDRIKKVRTKRKEGVCGGGVGGNLCFNAMTRTHFIQGQKSSIGFSVKNDLIYR